MIVDASRGRARPRCWSPDAALIAPSDDGPALLLSRIAAITFTRKAAGELKLRLREALLRARGVPGQSALRADRLRHAMDALDDAQIGTVHGFADRLLRLRPADARLSPEYEIAEDAAPYVEETFRTLLDAPSAARSGRTCTETWPRSPPRRPRPAAREAAACGCALRTRSSTRGSAWTR